MFCLSLGWRRSLPLSGRFAHQKRYFCRQPANFVTLPGPACGQALFRWSRRSYASLSLVQSLHSLASSRVNSSRCNGPLRSHGTGGMRMAEVTVAIPTYRRPRSLARLLEALERLQTSARVSVLVADNDASGREGFALCSALRERGYRWPLEAIIAPERGIAQVRNALTEQILAHSRPDFIAMLDDDEWPEPRWLDAFLEVQALTGADALHGAVVRDFEIPPARAAVACHGIAPLRHRSGPVPMIQSTSNVLVRRECFECLAAPCFDPAFALSGGEDRDFFERLRRQGRRFAWADEAVGHSWVPAPRTGLGWGA